MQKHVSLLAVSHFVRGTAVKFSEILKLYTPDERTCGIPEPRLKSVLALTKIHFFPQTGADPGSLV